MTAKRIINDIDPTSELEVSWVRRGANPMAKVFLKKSADQPPQPENTNMALKSVVLAGLMTSVAGAALAKSFTTDAELDAFVAKSDADQAADLTAFAKAKGMPCPADDEAAEAKKAAELKKQADAAAAAAAAAALVKTDAPVITSEMLAKALESHPAFVDLQKKLEVAEGKLEKAASSTLDTAIQKRAATEFKGLEVAKTVGILKAIDGIDAVAKADIEALMKAHGQLVSKVAGPLGLITLNKDANSATAQLETLAKTYAEANKVDFGTAFVKVNEDPANAALVEKADEEAAAA